MSEYLVTARPIRPGQILGPQDLRREYGDVTAQPANTLTETSQVVGHHARYAVATGNTVRSDMLRLPPAVQQGQTVKVIGTGQGFSVSNEGRALNRAGDGESVRVRLANGQVVTGIARNGGIVEVRF
jgi:flagella basal body P-ring formation protein FlgA